MLIFVAATAPRPGDIPALEGLTRYGYTVEQASDGFRGTVWAQYASRPEWKMLYAVERKRWQAVKDCEKWMDRMDAAVRKAAKHKPS